MFENQKKKTLWIFVLNMWKFSPIFSFSSRQDKRGGEFSANVPKRPMAFHKMRAQNYKCDTFFLHQSPVQNVQHTNHFSTLCIFAPIFNI